MLDVVQRSDLWLSSMMPPRDVTGRYDPSASSINLRQFKNLNNKISLGSS
ncbi:unnamed protein product [Acanthoscelides obtectus]|uniref:Uncharacterized protein n=1 Tax=Acanthoscelides obtectus TaxID=200917 RepID=A0A9P0KNE6_ACAOB|nr:unnamed protein product [Acanthoscelides obtectus]CAK1623572.1 hypothetical protein AOBTE_LOCUS2076 [Acanthoscelides obtectus]